MANTKPVGVAYSDPALVAGTTLDGNPLSATWTTGEIPSGTMNGSNKAFTLAHTPVTGITLVYNNATQFYGTDYTLRDRKSVV